MAFDPPCHFEDLSVGMKVKLRGSSLRGIIIHKNERERRLTVDYGDDTLKHTLTYTADAFHPYGTPETWAQCWILEEPPNPLEVY